MARGWRKESYRHSLAARGIKTKSNQRFWRNAQRELGPQYDVHSPDFMKRRMWYTAMIQRGKEGKIDNRSRAKKVYPLNQQTYELWQKDPKFRKLYDVEDLDTPLKDVKEIKIHGVSIYVGGRTKACRDDTEKLVKDVLKNNFTADEVRSLNNLYIEKVPYRIEQDARHSADTLSNRKRANIIELNEGKNSEETLTHELVHAVRWMKGLDARKGATATPSEEKKAELETIGRISEKAFKSDKDQGYYSFANNPSQAREIDRAGVSGNSQRKSRASSVSRRAGKYYDKSQIKKVDIDG